jgi:hypothetical protein
MYDFSLKNLPVVKGGYICHVALKEEKPPLRVDHLAI